MITIDKVTPELAAQIVKHFVIPMFDSDNKKMLRAKYKGMAATGNPDGQYGGTILGDLKLTTILSTQLEEIKSQVDSYQEKIEEVEAERDMYKKEINVIKTQYIQQKKQIGVLKEQVGLSFKLR